MSTHSKAPFVGKMVPDGKRLIVMAADGSAQIGEVNFDDISQDTAKANAALWLAAPDLLAFAECQEASEKHDGNLISRDDLLAVLEKHGYERGAGRFPLFGYRKWLRELRSKALDGKRHPSV